MSVWGTGNFERDDALNILDNWIQDIINQIRETFVREHETSLYEDHGEARIIANIDILCTLLERYNTYPIVELDEIENWKKNYLTTFDSTIHIYESKPDYIENRRQTIIETFIRLENVVDKFWEE